MWERKFQLPFRLVLLQISELSQVVPGPDLRAKLSNKQVTINATMQNIYAQKFSQQRAVTTKTTNTSLQIANINLELSLTSNPIILTVKTRFIRHTEYLYPGMLRPRGHPGLEAKIFDLGLVASGLGLVLGLMQCWPRSHEGWPHCQSPKARHLRYVDCSLYRKLLLTL